MVFFNPNSPRYQRGVIIAQWAIMAMAGAGVLLTNWGTRHHIFSDIQKHIIPKLDNLFKITPEEIETARVRYETSRNLDEALLTSAKLATSTAVPKLPPSSESEGQK